VIAQRTAAAASSDKLVELVTGRFSQHDTKLGLTGGSARVIAARPGDRRAEIEPLLAGGPDLARDAARAADGRRRSPTSSRDFRLVHFEGS
jgi:hypothetical protein